MTKKTQVIACIALALLIISGTAFLYVSHEVTRIGAELTRQVQLMANQYAQEQMLAELTQLVEDTATDRGQLEQYLLSETDTITFLADIERIGVQQGVELKTNSLAVSEEDGTSILTAAFSITGPQSLVLRMLTILENLPYESKLTKLDLTHGPLSELNVTLTLTLF